MKRNRFTVEQLISTLWRSEVELSKGRRGAKVG